MPHKTEWNEPNKKTTLGQLVQFLQKGIEQSPEVANEIVEEFYILTENSEIVSTTKNEET